MIRGILFSRQNPIQLLMSSLGVLIGIFLILFTVQGFMDFRSVLHEKNDWLHPEYLILNKKISILSSLQGIDGFSKEELEELQKISGVEKVAPFRSNLFKAAGSNMPGSSSNNRELYSELFFESLPEEMLDMEEGSFTWEEGDPVLPILIPSDYLKLYNFGYAPSQGMPQVSPKSLSTIRFRIQMDSLGQLIYKEARIVGYTQRIPSVLVPDSFLLYANTHYVAPHNTADPSRIIVEVKDPANTALLRHIEENGYESNEEQLKNSRLSNALKIISMVMAMMAGLILILSFLGFYQYSQLILYRNTYEIRTLLDLGMSPARIFKFYFKGILLLMSLISLISIVALYFIQALMSEQVGTYGLEFPSGLHFEVVLLCLLIFVLFVLIQSLGIRKGIYRLGPGK